MIYQFLATVKGSHVRSTLYNFISIIVNFVVITFIGCYIIIFADIMIVNILLLTCSIYVAYWMF